MFSKLNFESFNPFRMCNGEKNPNIPEKNLKKKSKIMYSNMASQTDSKEYE